MGLFFPSLFTGKNLTPILNKNQLRSCDENTTSWGSTFWAHYRGEWELSVVQESEYMHVKQESVKFQPC